MSPPLLEGFLSLWLTQKDEACDPGLANQSLLFPCHMIDPGLGMGPELSQ